MLALTIAATVHISVLGSFHPVQFELQPVQGQVLVVESQGHTEILQGERPFSLTGPAKVSGRNGSMVHFRLAVPGVEPREYIGRLEVRRSGSELLAIVEMDRETAVAAIVEAEGAAGLPFEARKAQAVVTRSYLAGAHNRHQGFDFCDTEHCQLLKGLAHPASAGSRAAAETHGQVLTYKGDVIPAMYSANCGGHTKSLAQTKWEGAAIPAAGLSVFFGGLPAARQGFRARCRHVPDGRDRNRAAWISGAYYSRALFPRHDRRSGGLGCSHRAPGRCSRPNPDQRGACRSLASGGAPSPRGGPSPRC